MSEKKEPKFTFLKFLILFLCLISTQINAGKLIITTHEGDSSFNNCTMKKMIFSDESFVNQYHIKCPNKIGRFTSSPLFDNNYVSALFYEDEELICPVRYSRIKSKKRFVIIFDCRIWL